VTPDGSPPMAAVAGTTVWYRIAEVMLPKLLSPP
jgi:hypothetical protein